MSILSIEATKNLLGLKDRYILDTQAMGIKLNVTFYPFEGEVKEKTREFFVRLKSIFEKYGVNIIPFEEALVKSNSKMLKKGIHVICLGEQSIENMPIERLTSIRESLIVMVLDDTENIRSLSYDEITDYGMKKLGWHMANQLITVGEDFWAVTAGNGSSIHSFSDEESVSQDVYNSVISKLAAPLRPLGLDEFIIEEGFDQSDSFLAPYMQDVINGSKEIGETGLLEYMIKIDQVKFKKESHKMLSQIVSDNRTGASFGFLSRQLPVKLEKAVSLDEASGLGVEFGEKDFTYHNEDLYLKYNTNGQAFCLKVPEVSTITSVSGSDKNNLSVSNIVKMKLKNGKMYLQFMKGLDLSHIRPSFDTKVILTHAVTNALFASIMNSFKPGSVYPGILESEGMALVHWHGYIKPSMIPRGWIIYGAANPAFMCSTDMSALNAFMVKEKLMMDYIFNKKEEFMGDVHIEPQHGINISWTSLAGIGNYLKSDHRLAKLGLELWEEIQNANQY